MCGMTCQKVFYIILFMVIMKHKKSLLLFAILTVASCGSLVISNLVSAAPQKAEKAPESGTNKTTTPAKKAPGNQQNQNNSNANNNSSEEKKTNSSTGSKGNNGCGTDTSIIKCDPGSDENPIINLLQQAVKVLYGVIGVLAVVVIMIAGVIYGTAGDREDRVKLAKTMITNTVIGILLYVFMTVILNFLVPGGVF